VDASGNPVTEGEYTCRLEAWDNNGNKGSSRSIRAVVDNTPPRIELHAPYKVFSPNGDGSKDLFILEQEGSYEKMCQGVIFDEEGTSVRTFNWESKKPGNLSWNGRNADGNPVEDGTYTYRITADDRAGNTTTKEYSPIILDTTETNIEISRRRSVFSPDGDEVMDKLVLHIDIPVVENLVDWRLDILNDAGTEVRSYSGTDAPEDTIVFDGRDEKGNVLPEGEYRARLSATYKNGNKPVSETPPFSIDLTPPEASVSVNRKVFSPNGDCLDDTIVVQQNTSEEDTWKGIIRNSADETVREINNPAASSGVCWICKELDCWRDLILRSSLQVLTLS